MQHDWGWLTAPAVSPSLLVLCSLVICCSCCCAVDYRTCELLHINAVNC